MGRRFRFERHESWAKRYLYRRYGGVIGNSRIVSHRYQDEGDNGPAHRREIRRAERRLWRGEAKEEAISRYEREGAGIAYLQEHQARKLINGRRAVWAVDYASGWHRRTVMDHDGKAIYTRWIPPEKV